ncbi:MAG: glycosyltransferase family 4 protein [Burkholderiales bacterium]|nr:glycosyltransferase family 4 protein [Burkholderiales bacterium]
MQPDRPPVFHLNPSPTLGGAEVYTGFLAQALQAMGWRNVVVAGRGARYWDGIQRGEVELREHEFRLKDDISGVPEGAVVCVHAPVPKGLMDRLARRYLVLGIGHQAVYSKSVPYYYGASHRLLPVSRHVAATLRAAGFETVNDTPLLGVADLQRKQAGSDISRGPMVEWDRRKARDRLFAWCEPIVGRMLPRRIFARRPGLTLGVVSRLAPLKQFPALFDSLMPVLQRQPDLNLEVFGSAIGYRALRELRAVLAPLGDRVRFWGFQADVAAVYAELDYLITGLPEREALGLNVIEAQQCGTPVLAPDAPPFTETMIDGVTGYLYADPRTDGGAGFALALERARAARPDPRLATAHLQQFSLQAFRERADSVFSAEIARHPAARHA